MASPIIDFRVRLPNEFRPQQELPAEYTSQYDEVLSISDNIEKTHADLVSEMDANGVDRAVVHAEFEFGDPADALNQAVADVVRNEADRFAGFGTISTDPINIMRAVRQAETCREYGMVGICFQPSFFHMAIDDRQFYPVYAKATELNLMVAVHTGVNYSVTHPIKNDHPLQLDQVACDFPDLTLIACHAGWPWVTEMVAVARKHPRVYMEFGGLAPKYVGAQGTGWEVMYRFMNSLLAGQVLFGTDWPVITMERAISEWQSLGLKDHVLEGVLGSNAARLIEAHQ